MDLDILVWFVAALAFLKAIVDSAAKSLEAAEAEENDKAVAVPGSQAPAVHAASPEEADISGAKPKAARVKRGSWKSRPLQTRKDDIERWGMRMGVFGSGLATIVASGRLLMRQDIPFATAIGAFGVAYVLVLFVMAYLSNFLTEVVPLSNEADTLQ